MQITGGILSNNQPETINIYPLHVFSRLDGKDQLICCSVDGEVRGYQTDKSRTRVVDGNRATTDIRELNLSKQNLLLELQNYEREKEPLKANQFTSTEKIEGGIIPVRILFFFIFR